MRTLSSGLAAASGMGPCLPELSGESCRLPRVSHPEHLPQIAGRWTAGSVDCCGSVSARGRECQMYSRAEWNEIGQSNHPRFVATRLQDTPHGPASAGTRRFSGSVRSETSHDRAEGAVRTAACSPNQRTAPASLASRWNSSPERRDRAAIPLPSWAGRANGLRAACRSRSYGSPMRTRSSRPWEPGSVTSSVEASSGGVPSAACRALRDPAASERVARADLVGQAHRRPRECRPSAG